MKMIPRLRPALSSFLAFQLLASAGCSPKYDKANGTRILSGSYRLNSTNNCTYGPVDSDVLVLHPDGRLEQHVRLKDGRKFDSEQGRWEFSPPSNVWLDDRWDFHFENTRKDPEKGSYSLTVEFFSKEPPVIVVDPDDNCFYERGSTAQPIQR